MKIKNGLNSQKMKHCKKKILWNDLDNNWLKGKLKIFVTIICGVHFDRKSRMSCKKFHEKCYDQGYLRILLNVYNY